MKKRIVCLVMALLLLGTLTGCALFQTTVEDMDEADAAPYYSMGEGFLTALFAGDYAACSALCSEDLRNQMSESDLQSAWENMRLTYGDPVSVAGQKPYWINGEGTVVYQVACAHGGCSIQLTYDADNNVAGLWFGLPEEDFPYEVAVPEGVTEIEITLGEGTDTPLKALVTLPADAEGPVPGVVLVHGSGANDRNEAIGGCYPFADLAHGLAQRGIASIRYDKRTYTYGNSYTEEEVNAMTAREEVLDDAQLAIEALAAQPGVDAERIVVVGHSLGGMLAPRIAQESGGKVAGIVSLAGTARGYRLRPEHGRGPGRHPAQYHQARVPQGRKRPRARRGRHGLRHPRAVPAGPLQPPGRGVAGGPVHPDPRAAGGERLPDAHGGLPLLGGGARRLRRPLGGRDAGEPQPPLH